MTTGFQRSATSSASGLYQFPGCAPRRLRTKGEGEATNPKHAMVNQVDIGPDISANPAAAEAAFRPEWPGESGGRRQQGFFSREARSLEFSWHAFKATNSVRYLRSP